METELAELVVAGTKRATATSLEMLLLEGAPMPQPGDHSVIYDGAETACCIIRTTSVQRLPGERVRVTAVAMSGSPVTAAISARNTARRVFPSPIRFP